MSEEEELSENEYEVEKVLDSRIRDGEREYFLKWKGYPMSECTWEKESGMNCDDLVEEYWSRVKKEKSTRSKGKRLRPQRENDVVEEQNDPEPEKEEETVVEEKEKEKQKVPKVSQGIWWLKDYGEKTDDEDDGGFVVYEPEVEKAPQKGDDVSEEENSQLAPPLFDFIVSHRETLNGFDLLVRWFVFFYEQESWFCLNIMLLSWVFD